MAECGVITVEPADTENGGGEPPPEDGGGEPPAGNEGNVTITDCSVDAGEAAPGDRIEINATVENANEVEMTATVVFTATGPDGSNVEIDRFEQNIGAFDSVTLTETVVPEDVGVTDGQLDLTASVERASTTAAAPADTTTHKSYSPRMSNETAVDRGMRTFKLAAPCGSVDVGQQEGNGGGEGIGTTGLAIGASAFLALFFVLAA